MNFVMFQNVIPVFFYLGKILFYLKAIQLDAYSLLGKRTYFSFSGHHEMSLVGVLNEKVWTGPQWSPPDVTSGWFLYLMSERGQGLTYSEVQYIMGNYHTGDTPSCGMTDTHLWNHYLPAISLAGSNNWDGFGSFIRSKQQPP